MKHAMIINGHYPYPDRQGRLNTTLADMAAAHFEAAGWGVLRSNTADDYDPAEEAAKMAKADIIIWQHPVHWMGLPWRVKQYIDEVLGAAHGTVWISDGRSSENPKANYGAGGLSQDKKYMLSLTFNAPREAFDNPDEYLMQGGSIDDLMCPMHKTMRFLGMQQLPTFSCHDVVKRPEVESDFARFQAVLEGLTAPCEAA